ncbi:hypothetical protein BJX66DRAFT_344936 [Aspergillus keveii]|uniref:C2H2-type domain-containing protein n=1 Tax=Aspergillus keveii TaxID=714993 RepID=A0ABR4FJM9_9EURO
MLQTQYLDNIFASADSSENTKFQFTQRIFRLHICTAPRCQYAVPPSTLLTHLRTRHGSHPAAATLPLREAALEAMLQRPWADPAREPGLFPPPGGPPVPGLPIYQGYGCPHCPYITRSLKATQNHRRQAHQDQDSH